MSPRAGCRLEALGFTMVYDYVDGIADWRAAGLPMEGTADPKQQVADATRPDVPTCQPADPIEEVHQRLVDAGWEVCLVVDCDRMVVGRLRREAIESGTGQLAEEVMEPGPSTVRPDGLLQPLVERMERRHRSHVVVTTAQEQLLGILLFDEAKRLLAGEPPHQIWRECDGCPGLWAATG